MQLVMSLPYYSHIFGLGWKILLRKNNFFYLLLCLTVKNMACYSQITQITVFKIDIQTNVSPHIKVERLIFLLPVLDVTFSNFHY